MAFKEDWMMVNKMPTRFITCGGWIGDLNENDRLIFLIPGNPGVVEFYREFIEHLHEKTNIPVWGVCHAGHEMPSTEDLSILKEDHQWKFHDLEMQVEHKAYILQNLMPRSCRVYVIGHSMGAKITLELLKIADVEPMLVQCYLLFPTLERIAETPNAKFVQPFIRYASPLVILFSWFFTLLPIGLKRSVVRSTFRRAYGGSSSCTVDAGLKLLRPSVLRHVFHLVRDEMEKIKELDTITLKKHTKKFKIYFGMTDRWSPLSYFGNLKKQVPDIDAKVCDQGMQHAFSISSSEAMANIIAKWIEQADFEKVHVVQA